MRRPGRPGEGLLPRRHRGGPARAYFLAREFADDRRRRYNERCDHVPHTAQGEKAMGSKERATFERSWIAYITSVGAIWQDWKYRDPNSRVDIGP